MKKDDGGYVYPVKRDVEYTGMTYRQWLVGMAMQGYLAHGDGNKSADETIAKLSCRIADAVIAEEKK